MNKRLSSMQLIRIYVTSGKTQDNVIQSALTSHLLPSGENGDQNSFNGGYTAEVLSSHDHSYPVELRETVLVGLCKAACVQ
ncbi:hypothetical protein NECAME_02689 [Necator americanus]|uniref:Uncharacterized protein n=1 Tax=Necator americanus TaxID=51031 RepID=W2TBS0_NECAM|nr:hypothetical protein NECAME_02689 [Necator americanus]ETN79263.1 hypothetical protein NECAME_02689 [Necator americanus]